MTRSIMHCLCVFVFLATLACTLGLSIQPNTSKTRSVSFSTKLNSWSLQIPSNFGKSTWYNEVHNPTARKQVYDDVRDFRFFSVASDWPSMSDMEEAERAMQSQPQRRVNPIRRAARWITRRRRS